MAKLGMQECRAYSAQDFRAHEDPSAYALG